MDDEEEEYVLYGTPLPELEDEAALRKKAAKESQVRDEKGRQRFHGAFTGGFSAGYFNTVGTKEGWSPSTFVSSRSKIADHVHQNPEDFMDEEDFGDFGIATRKIHTTVNFQDASVTNSNKRKHINIDSVIPGEAPLRDIVQPVRESIGILILRKLGWRQGQGVGPRVKKQSASIKIYGCSPFPDAVISDEYDPMSESFTFAPKDTEEIFYKPKDNYFGLGYSGLSKQSVLAAQTDEFAPTSTKSWLSKDRKKLTISGQAFGVGAYEDDDADIYAKDDMSQYDFSDLALRESDFQKTIGSGEKGIIHGVIEGFHLASQPPPVKKHYPPPELPRNFEPVHLKQVRRHSENIIRDTSRHALSASDRSLILGEKKFLKAPALDVTSIQAEKKTSDMEKLAKPSSSTSLNFQPFSNDLSKQQRYEEYLKLRKEGDVRKLEQPSSMTEWEKQQEIEEFAKTAVFFQPLSNALKSRFESRSHLSVEHEVILTLEKIKKEKEEKSTAITKRNMAGSSNRKTFVWHPVTLLCKRFNVPNPYPNSSNSGTQNSQKIKSVFEHLSFGYESSNKEKNIFSSLASSSKLENKTTETAEGTPTKTSEKTSLSSDTATAPENKENTPAENKRPPIDFFKDIFENSSSDEDSTPNEEDPLKPAKEINSKDETVALEYDNISEKDSVALENEKAIEVNKQQLLNTESSNTQNASTVNKKVGFGVFANLDLDALNQRPPKVQHQKGLDSEKSKIEIGISSYISQDNLEQSQPKSDDAYGPELPPNYSCENPSSPASYKIEKCKHVKHKSKHKHHKHKSKKKKKKKSSKRESSDTDSEDDLEDIPPTLIIEKLKKLHKKKS